MKNLKSNLQQAVLIIPLVVAMLSLGVMATAAPGWSNTNMSAWQSDQIQLSDVQPSSAWQSSYQGYQSQIFEVGTTNVPSDYSEISSESSGSHKVGPRKLGGGTDTGTQEQTSPIGEPWIMVIFALIVCGIIAYRRINLKHHSIMRTFKFKSIFIALVLLTLGVGKVWSTPGARYYLIGDPKGDWNKADNYKIQTRYEKDGKYVFYIYAATDNYFRLKKDDNADYGPSSDGSTDQGYGAYNTNAWKYSGTSGIVMFGADETSGNNGEHYPYVFWSKPTVQIKHNWNNADASWTAKDMEDKGNGKYEYIGKYSGSNATNCGIGSDGKTMKYFTNATLVGSPAQGNDCLFEYNSSGFKGFGTQTQNTGSLTITKLLKITYNTNGATGGSAPSNQENIKYNTSKALQENSGGLYKTGYTFAGWNTAPGGGGTDYVPGKSYTITSNLTLYAKWVATDRTMYFYNKNDWSGTIYAHLWNTSPVTWSEKEWPGTAMTEHQDKIYKYDYASSVFSKVQFNANANDKKTGDLTIPDYDQAFYNLESNSWTRYIMVAAFPTETIAAVVGEQATVEPVVAWADGVPFYDISITAVRQSGGSTNVNAIVAGTKLIVSGTAAGTATFTVTYSYLTTTITKTLKVKIMAGIPIQAKISTGDNHWTYTNIVKMHYWGTGIATSDLTMTWMKTDGGYNYYQALVPTGTDGYAKFLFYYDYMKDKDNNQWRQTNDVSTNTSKCYTISYSGSESSHSNVSSSSSGLCYTTYQVRVIMGSGEIYTSNIVQNSSSTISFFAPSNANETLSYRRGTVTLEQNGVTKKTYDASTFSQSGVYTAKINTSTYALTNLALYTGDYYIRTDGASGGWDNYKASNKDNGMTYFARNANFPNETFSYYWVKNLAKSSTVNIKATVANDYNPVLCSFSPDEKVTGDENGVNIRFGYEPTTNDIVRGILKGSTTNNFLNIVGEDGNIYKESARTTCLNEARYTSNPGDSKLDDMSDWVYGRVVYAYVESTSSTADVVLKANFNGVHYLLGMQKDASGHETSIPITYRVIKAGTTAGTYPLRVVYDFKTNRLFGAWAPEGTLDVTSTLNVDADVIFLRHETNDVAQINIQTSSAKVDKIEHAIFALEVENDAAKTLKNRELHYFISLPFDCKVSNIFGIGKFMTYWGIQRYRGDLRAQKGWFIETPTFWEWLDADDVMQKGEGYLLSIDKKALQNDGQWKEYGGKSQLTLYFPSTSAGFTITQAQASDLTITYPNEPCNITYKNRNLQDGNWKCIGTPGFKNITVSSYTPQAGETWYNNPPNFLYTFNEQTTTATYAKGTYTPTNGRTFTYHSFTSYMVQYAGTINWAVYSKGSESASIAAKRVPFETEKKTKLQLDLIGEDGTPLDRTFVWLQEDATLGFDQNLDLNKIIESGANQIYSLAEHDVPFAANVLPLGTDTVALVVNIAQDGEYIFSVPEEEHIGMAPILYDMYKSEQINLLNSDYLVELKKGKYDDRFFLLFQPEAPIVTSFESTADGGQQTHSNEAIYDVLGRRVNTIYPGHLYIVNGEKRIAK